MRKQQVKRKSDVETSPKLAHCSWIRVDVADRQLVCAGPVLHEVQRRDPRGELGLKVGESLCRLQGRIGSWVGAGRDGAARGGAGRRGAARERK